MERSESGWLFKWEVTHFSDLIYDTQQVSIIRGSSERAAAAAEEAKKVAEAHGAETIYAAASQALFYLPDPLEDRARALVTALEEGALAGDFPIPTVASYLPAPAPGAEPLRQSIWECERRNELRRTQRLGIFTGRATTAAALDTFDQVRLADGEPLTQDGETRPLSAWSRLRYQSGRRGHRLLAQANPEWVGALDALDEEQYQRSMDLTGLAQAGTSGNLIALVYADGIGFTQKREQAPDRAGLKALSRNLSAFMDQVLREAIAPDLADLQRSRVLVMPIHRLLGAGDEFLLVCRSHRALPLAQAIHDTAARRPVELAPGVFTTLSFAVGVVIAPVTTPIRLLRRLAHELEGSAKDHAKRGQPSSPTGGATDFAVLRGIHIPERSSRSLREDLLGVSALRKEWFEVRIKGEDEPLLLHGRPLSQHRLAALLRDAALLRRSLSVSERRRLLLDLATSLRSAAPGGIGPVRKALQQTRERLLAKHRDLQPLLDRLQDDLEHQRRVPLADLDEVLELGAELARAGAEVTS